jgi:predicted ATPase
MTDQKSPRQPIPRIESIRIKNYRALHNLQLKPLTLLLLLGPNGSDKSTGLST